MQLIPEAINIKGRLIGPGHPVYIVAEMSANHRQDLDRAIEILKAAKEAGADAVKLQTYTPDTMTLDCENEYFRIKGSIWEGKRLYDLYKEAYTPWDWHPTLKELSGKLGIDFFSTAFDNSAVDFLEQMDVNAYKIASFEIVDLPLIRRVAQTGKPIIMSTGMATLAEIEEAVCAVRDTGNNNLALLKCTSAYPAQPEDMNLSTIPHLSLTFGVPVGLSDHSLSTAVPVAGVSLGACIVEKHFTLSRSGDGPDNAFSLDPVKFKAMVEDIRTTEKALGRVHYGAIDQEGQSRMFRRSLFVVQDMKVKEMFTSDNVRSIRPGHGLHTRFFEDVLGRYANQDIKRGTPLTWDLIEATDRSG